MVRDGTLHREATEGTNRDGHAEGSSVLFGQYDIDMTDPVLALLEGERRTRLAL